MNHDIWTRRRAREQRDRAARVARIDLLLQACWAALVCLFIVGVIIGAAYVAGRQWGLW